jgi:starch synthase (maltosyl-transferring)
VKEAPSELQGRARPVIEHVTPQVDAGRHPVKREVGDLVLVEADVFVDGVDELACDVLWRAQGNSAWQVSSMRPLGNDRWRASFPLETRGRHLFRIRATVDAYGTWLRDIRARSGDWDELRVELLVGAELLAQGAGRAEGQDRNRLQALATQLRSISEAGVAEARGSGSSAPGKDPVTNGDLVDARPLDLPALLDVASSPEVIALVRRHPDPGPGITSEAFPIVAERAKARFSTWYELFPRSTSVEPGRHGTLADTRARLDYVAGMGFDVLYLPPVHPIGETNRKGRDGVTEAKPDDPGSPWAIGSPEGGHFAVHPQLGTLEDLVDLVGEAARRGMEVALDLAFQCSPDHPWVTKHPEWFRWLPDGSARFAENPPKRYEDIYPIYFDTPDWRALWAELLDVALFWASHGVRIFRVDNPHTKPFRFWEWFIAEVKAAYPDVLFLAEAFTRPKVMQRLAKAGFTQSYTYFTWRNTKREFEEYLTELHSTEIADFMRPILWPNTPDILSGALQHAGRAAFMSRLVLAATAAASYGIYGPVFELCENEPRAEGTEEYLHSEKYEIRHFVLAANGAMGDLVTRVNEIRRGSQVLQHDRNLALCSIGNDRLIAYARTRPLSVDHGELETRPELDTRPIVVVVNLDPTERQSGWVELDLESLGIDPARPYEAYDLLTGTRYSWQGPRNYVILDPAVLPAHILRVGEPTRATGL